MFIQLINFEVPCRCLLLLGLYFDIILAYGKSYADSEKRFLITYLGPRDEFSSQTALVLLRLLFLTDQSVVYQMFTKSSDAATFIQFKP